MFTMAVMMGELPLGVSLLTTAVRIQNLKVVGITVSVISKIHLSSCIVIYVWFAVLKRENTFY